MNKVLDLLTRAGDHIEPDGMWYQGWYYENQSITCVTVSNDPCCPLGALGWAAAEFPGKTPLTREHTDARLMLRAELPKGFSYVSLFADHHPDTTHDDIRALFARAIAASG